MRSLVFAFLCCTLCSAAFGQDRFTNCSAAFLDSRMIVDEYSPTGKSVLSATATGQLSVGTVELSPNEYRLVKPLRFKVAIRDGNTKTLLSFSDETYERVNVQSVLAKCQKGDAIVLLTLETDYALPHNEILVQ